MAAPVALLSSSAAQQEETQMTEQRCIPVEYRYRREPVPKSRRWHMNCCKAAAQPANQAPGVVNVSHAGEDQVSIFMAVPCNQEGGVDPDTQGDYEDLADQKFKEIRPDADLA